MDLLFVELLIHDFDVFDDVAMDFGKLPASSDFVPNVREYFVLAQLLRTSEQWFSVHIKNKLIYEKT